MSLYQRMKVHKNKPEFWIMLVIALVIIGLSFGQTGKLAVIVGATEWYKQVGFAILVEILFALSLLKRANQRASGKHVPWFLNLGYYGLLGAITVINMSVLYQTHPIAGPFVGGLISAGMLYVESLFVWEHTDADRPAKKSPKQLMREAKREIEEEEIMQLIEYLKYESRKPRLKLIKRARRDERKRKRVESGESIWPWARSKNEGLPEYFRREPEPTPQIEAEPITIIQEPEKEEVVVETAKEVAVVPFKRQIGFHMETDQPKTKAPRFQPNVEARENAKKVAENLMIELGRKPKKRELIEAGLSEHYAKVGLDELKKKGI